MARRMAQKAVRRLLRPIRGIPDPAILGRIRAQIWTRSPSSWIWFLELQELIVTNSEVTQMLWKRHFWIAEQITQNFEANRPTCWNKSTFFRRKAPEFSGALPASCSTEGACWSPPFCAQRGTFLCLCLCLPSFLMVCKDWVSRAIVSWDRFAIIP